jgi:extracellular factor (EF) 3-hydroxypalmitic acid methyl ester biosynthesis protein
LRLGDLGLGGVTATAQHPTLDQLSGTVADLSIHGLGLVVPQRAKDAFLVLAGDRLSRVSVSADGRVIHEGPGVVRRVSEQADDLSIGVELDAPGLDLSEIYRQSARRTLGDRWKKAHQAARYRDVSMEFKAWVASVRAYLESVEAFLAREERTLANEDLATRRVLESELLDVVAPDVAREIVESSAELARMVSRLSDEEHATYRAFCRGELGGFFAKSPFMRRAQEKPLGYAGDYEMMNMLYRDHAEGADLFGKVLNLYATSEMAARANVNRIEYLCGKIEAAALSRGEGRLRVASIGSGPGHEIRHLLTTKPELGPRLDIALIDQEERAIAYCERSLSRLARSTGARLRIIPESVRRLLAGSRLSSALGERDLVYSAGLFDYLSDRAFGALLSTLYEGLAPGGALMVGNVATHNPSRWVMEYFLEWFLIHRSPSDLLALGNRLASNPGNVRVESEPLGVNLFLCVDR